MSRSSSVDPTALNADIVDSSDVLSGRMEKIEDVDDDGRLGWNQRVQLHFQHHHNVGQLFDDAPIEPDAQLILKTDKLYIG